jgi:hypothetical protein
MASKNTPSISDESVLKATSKNWKQWFTLLDKDKAKALSHKEIAKLLATKYSVEMWWCQMITVEYERHHGLRVVHQKSDGNFAASGSITVNVPIDMLYQSWISEKQRQQWLPAMPLNIRKSTNNKSLRITWEEVSNLSVYFYNKGATKSQVTIEHDKLKNVSEVKKMKAFWKKSLQELKSHLEAE